MEIVFIYTAYSLKSLLWNSTEKKDQSPFISV